MENIKQTILLSISLLFFSTHLLHAQINKGPKWQISVSKTDVKVGDVVEVHFKADVPDGWYIYSTYVKCKIPLEGMAASTIEGKDASYSLVGKLYSIGDKKKYDDLMECDEGKFYKKAHLVQKIKLLNDKPNVKLGLHFQMCKTVCTQINTDLMDVKGFKFASAAIKKDPIVEPTVKPKKPKNVIKEKPVIPIKIDKSKKVKDSQNIEQQTTGELTDIQTNDSTIKASEHIQSGTSSTKKNVDFTNLTDEQQTLINNTRAHYSANNDSEVGQCNPITKSDEKSLWGLFIFAALAGFVALLTPCVFPMIPMTVSFFMKSSGSKAKGKRDAIIFVLTIVALFTIVGSVVSALFGADATHFISTHWLPNVLFFIIFVLFAASFFGAFEIQLPSKFVNKMDAKADKGGLAGIMFMAFTIVLVSFSCTGPIMGAVLAGSLGGIKPIVAMMGFAIAFAIPFGLFAFFPSLLSGLPKSGGWLNSVKVVLGFIELAFGLKFLSVADQTYHWGILDREVYLALWIVIFFLMGVYLLGKLKFSHDSDLPYLKVPRLFLAIGTFAFVMYMIPGMWGAPLKAISGYLPPMSTQDFDLTRNKHNQASLKNVKYGSSLHVPNGLPGFFDLEEAVLYARQVRKPLFLDFTGHGCVNCRKMEADVWTDPAVAKILEKDVVIVSLYTDDKVIELNKEDQFKSRVSGDMVTMLGKKNAIIQECVFEANAQPEYLLVDVLDNDLHVLNQPVYTSTVKEFVDFLEDGIKKFEVRKTK